jgi:hypothetical protein
MLDVININRGPNMGCGWTFCNCASWKVSEMICLGFCFGHTWSPHLMVPPTLTVCGNLWKENLKFLVVWTWIHLEKDKLDLWAKVANPMEVGLVPQFSHFSKDNSYLLIQFLALECLFVPCGLPETLHNTTLP